MRRIHENQEQNVTGNEFTPLIDISCNEIIKISENFIERGTRHHRSQDFPPPYEIFTISPENYSKIDIKSVIEDPPTYENAVKMPGVQKVCENCECSKNFVNFDASSSNEIRTTS